MLAPIRLTNAAAQLPCGSGETQGEASPPRSTPPPPLRGTRSVSHWDRGRCWHQSVSPTLVLARLGNATASLPLRGQPRRKALRSYPAGQVRRKEKHPLPAPRRPRPYAVGCFQVDFRLGCIIYSVALAGRDNIIGQP